MTVSPIWVTMPPSTVGSTTTTMSTSLPVAALSDAARRVFWSSVSSTAERTSAMWRSPLDAVSSSSRSTMAGQLADPAVADDQRDERDGGVATPCRRAGPRRSAVRRAAGQVRVAEGVAQLVVALDDAGEAEQLVLHLVDVALGRDDVEERLGVEQRCAGRS